MANVVCVCLPHLANDLPFLSAAEARLVKGDRKGGLHGRAHNIKRQEERSILINFVLDKSGSMEVIREATIAGFNQFLRDQQEEGGSAAMTLTLFDSALQHCGQALPLSAGTASQRAQLRPRGFHGALRRHRPHHGHHRRVRGRAQARPGAVRHHDRRRGELQPRVRPAADHGDDRAPAADRRLRVHLPGRQPGRVRRSAAASASSATARSTTLRRPRPRRPPWSGCR